MSVPSIAQAFQAYVATNAVGAQTVRVPRSAAAMVTALLRYLKKRSTLTALWLVRAAPWNRILRVSQRDEAEYACWRDRGLISMQTFPAATAAWMSGCATVEAEVPTVEQPVHANRIGQVQEGHRLRYAVCLTCPERTVKTLGKEPQPASTARVTLIPPTKPLTPRALVATVNFDFASSAITAHTRAALDSPMPEMGSH